MLGRVLVAGIALLVLGYVGGAAYTLNRASLDTVVMCAAGERGLYIPAAGCRAYLKSVGATYAPQEKSAALAAALALYSRAQDPAARALSLEQAALLLEQGADVDGLSPYDGLRPLHAAVIANEPELVRYLRGKGANTAARDAQFDKTPLELANWLETTKQLDLGAVRQALTASP